MEHGPAKERCPGCDWKGRTPEQYHRPAHTCEEHSPEKQVLRVLREHGASCKNRQDLHELVVRAGVTKTTTDQGVAHAVTRALSSNFATDADRKIYADLKTPRDHYMGATEAERSALSRAAAANRGGTRTVSLADAKEARALDAARRLRLTSEEETRASSQNSR